jgi:hypothetical protein
MSCPKCKSEKLGGLMEAFWVPIDNEGEMLGQWSDYSSETEVGDKRICYDCGHEFEIDDEDNNT